MKILNSQVMKCIVCSLQGDLSLNGPLIYVTLESSTDSGSPIVLGYTDNVGR